ncbi:MAG: hypothetical protein ABI904_07210 [Chloroflexota bacterium]
MTTQQPQHRIIPIYTSRGEAEAFLVYPYIFNRTGEWIGWATPTREVYSVLGYYVGMLTDDARIVRKRSEDDNKLRLKPPPKPGKIAPPATIPLAPLMQDLTYSLIDVLQEAPELLHGFDSGEFRQDMD